MENQEYQMQQPSDRFISIKISWHYLLNISYAKGLKNNE